MSSLEWQCLPFTRMSRSLLYQAFALRASVFGVEQNCVYLDLDGNDPNALIVVGVQAQQVIATARVLRPGLRYAEASIGRVCTAAAHRGQGIGRLLTTFAIACTRSRHPGFAIRISAQAYLKAFYESFGFQAASAPYLEDGILHVEMLLAP